MKLLAGILILTILVMFYIYYSRLHKITEKKAQKETFIDSSFLETSFHNAIQRTDSEIREKEDAIIDKQNEFDLLKLNLQHLQTQISIKREELSSLRSDQTQLNHDFDNLTLNIKKLNEDIAEFSGADFVNHPAQIDIFALNQVKIRKDSINDEITRLKEDINNSLIYYDEEDISDITKIGDIHSGLIKDLDDIKTTYERVYKVLKENTSFMEICSGNSLDGYPDYVKDYIGAFDREEICKDIDLTAIDAKFTDKINEKYDLGSNICSSKKGTCIYEDSTKTPKSYYTDTFDYKFYRHKWPQEGSCEAQSNSCFSFGTLSDEACDGDVKELWFTKENARAEYYSSNVGYISNPLPDNPGNWECIVDFPGNDWIDDENRIKSEAEDNCLTNGSYGVQSYDCYSVTPEELNPSKSKTGGKSKTWNNITNVDGSIGQCSVDDTCRTNVDTNNHVACLEENYKSNGNFQCWTMNADNTVSAGDYRNTYQLGEWNPSNNKMKMGECTTKTGECRTEFDVRSNVECITKDNWSCATFSEEPSVENIGDVTVKIDNSTQRKTYNKLNYINLNNQNKGVGSCAENASCLNPADLEKEADCHNINNHRCWLVNESTHNANQMNKLFKTYNRATELCEEDNSCLSMESALSTAEENCHNSHSDKICYKIDDTTTNNDGSKNIIFDEGVNNEYPNGRSTIFTISPTSGTCSNRDGCTSDVDLLCQNQTVNCYDKSPGMDAPTTTSKTMVYNGNDADKKCVPPANCSLIPHCSYIETKTGSPNVFDANDIDNVDCSDGNTYGKKYKWNLESSDQVSIDNPGSYVTDYSKWTPIVDNSPENTLCVRDPIKINSIPLTASTEQTAEYGCQTCPFTSLPNPDEGWTSTNVSGTENKQDAISIPTASSANEEIELISVGEGLMDNGDGTISYDTRAIISDGACPDRRDASVLNTSDYDQKVVVEHRRTIPPDPSATGCVPKSKIEVKYTLAENGGRCIFDCMQYFDDNDMESTCYSKVDFHDHNSGGGDIIYTEAACGESGMRFPSRKIREGRNGGAGCTGNPTNGETLQQFYNEKMGTGVDCSMPACECTESYYSGWAPPPGDSTPINWDRMANSVPCDQTYTHTRTLQNCDTSSTQLEQTQEISLSGMACCTPNDGTWGPWIDSSDGSSYGNANTPTCPTDLCNGNTIDLTRTTTDRVTCVNGVTNNAQETETHTCSANASPSDGSISNWSDCPLCVNQGDTARQTGTRTGKTVCSNGRVTPVNDSTETQDCNPQPPTCDTIIGNTKRAKNNSTCNTNGLCDWTSSSPSKSGTRPAESQFNTINGAAWRDDGTMPCSVLCAMPQAPSGLSATNITENSFVLSWTPNTDGDATLSSYTIKYQKFVSNEGGTLTEQWQEVNNVSSSSTTHTITNLDHNTSYNVKVRKIFSSGPDGIESSNREVQTTKLTNKVNLFFDLRSFSRSFPDNHIFRFKNDGEVYNKPHRFNNESFDIEEGGFAINLMKTPGSDNFGLLLYDFDLENLDFVEVIMTPAIGYEGEDRTLKIDKHEIENLIKNKTASTRGGEIYGSSPSMIHQRNHKMIHTIPLGYRVSDGTYYIRNI